SYTDRSLCSSSTQPPTPQLYTLSLHDALPIFGDRLEEQRRRLPKEPDRRTSLWRLHRDFHRLCHAVQRQNSPAPGGRGEGRAAAGNPLDRPVVRAVPEGGGGFMLLALFTGDDSRRRRNRCANCATKEIRRTIPVRPVRGAISSRRRPRPGSPPPVSIRSRRAPPPRTAGTRPRTAAGLGGATSFGPGP